MSRSHPTPGHTLRLVGNGGPVRVDACAPRPALRIADPGPPTPATAQDSGADAPDAVAREMRSAARLSALDSRWILAVQVSRAIGQGPGGVLTPDERRRLMTLGERLGLRTFDTSLVIAIVQDAARSRQDSLGSGVVDRLFLVRPGPDLFETPKARWTTVGAWALIIVASAFAFAYALTRWIAG